MLSFLLVGLLCSVSWRSTHAQTMDEIIQRAMQRQTSPPPNNNNRGRLRHAHHPLTSSGRETVLVELDMMYSREDWDAIQQLRAEENGGRKRKKRKARANQSKRWTNNIIPYELADDTFCRTNKISINAAINDWMRYTCLVFRQRTTENNYLLLQNGDGCSSYVGMIGGSQAVTLASGCRTKGVIIHELGHAIGFRHEHSRNDRDQYVRVLSQNIQSLKEDNFEKYSTEEVNNMGVPYDYTSIMHYGQYFFSVDKTSKPTIQTLDCSKQNVIGNRHGLSFRDIKLANLMYNCNNSCPSKTCPGEGFVGKDCKCWCPGSPVQECP